MLGIFVILLFFEAHKMKYEEIIIKKDYRDLNPHHFGYETCAKSHHYGPAIRTIWFLHYIISGSGIFRIGDKEYPLSKGWMFVIPPFVETYYEADAKDPWEYTWVGFQSEKLPMALPDVIYCPAAARVFEDMKNTKNAGNGRTEFLCAKLWELFSVLMEHSDTKDDYIELALGIIHADYMLKINVTKIAERLNLDRTYFSTLFRKRMGVSPKQYLQTYRMEQALPMLRNGHSVTKTALSVGYDDIYTFSKMFKRHFGVSPIHFQETENI